MDKLRFGTAGIPISTEKRSTIEGIKQVRELGLDAMELEFVNTVYLKEGQTEDVKKLAKNNDVVLTCHSPYYINLAAKEKAKLKASANRLLSAARITSLAGGWSTCFHPAFYLGRDPHVVYDTVEKELSEIVKKLKDEGHAIWVRPELTGKGTQFGDLNEIVKLSQDIEGVLPCIDFAHLHARHNGKFNSIEEWKNAFAMLERKLGRLMLDNMHIHIAGIEYSEKGERRHLVLDNSDLNYQDLLKVWKDFRIKGVVICESPNIEEDSMMLQKIYEKLR